MEDTWGSRDLPVLTYLVERFDRIDVSRVDLAEIEQATGLSVEAVARAVRALDEAAPPLIEGGKTLAEMSHPVTVHGITERARTAVGAWPTPDSLVDRLVAALNTAADEEPDPTRKSKLREVARMFGGAMRDVAVEVAGSTLARGIGM